MRKSIWHRLSGHRPLVCRAALMGLSAEAVVLSVGFAVLVDIYQFSGQATPIEFVPPAITYLANILFLIPIWVVMHEKSVKEHLMTSFSRPRQSEKSE